MSLSIPFFGQLTAGQRQQIIVIDLSTRTTKAILLRRKGDGFALVNYCLQEAPVEGAGRPEGLAEHFKSLRRGLGAKTRDTILVTSMEDSTLRNVEVPPMGMAELREMLKLNSRHFFQQDMPGCVFDCFTPLANGDHDPAAKNGKLANVLVGTVKGDFLHDLQEAARKAGLHILQVTPAQTGLANAALETLAELRQKKPLVLLHIGANTSTVSFLAEGTLALTRGIGMGSHQLGAGLAEACKTPATVAEEFKPSLIQSNLQNVLGPLARDVRGAIDYFEDLKGRQVSDGFLASDLFRSNLIVDALQDLEIPCRRLSLNGALAIELPADKEASLQKDSAQLDVGVGAGAGWFRGQRIAINFLAEQSEAAAARRRDPLRWTAAIGALLGVLILLWAASIWWQSSKLGAKVTAAQSDLQSVEKAATDAIAASRSANEIDRTLGALHQHATNRFLWARPLDALQFAAMDQIQVVSLKLEQTLGQVARAPATAKTPAITAKTKEQMLLTITAKNFGDTDVEEKFIERIASLPYFENSLRKKDPVLLKNRLPRQVDPLDPAKTFTLFTIECHYSERIIGHE